MSAPTKAFAIKQITDVTNTLENEFDLHTDAVYLYVRGFEDYKTYQSLFGLSESQ